MLTEQEVSRSWRQLFNKGELTSDAFSKAKGLIEELRAESPLRHRLSIELEELRAMHAAKNKKPRRKAPATEPV